MPFFYGIFSIDSRAHEAGISRLEPEFQSSTVQCISGIRTIVMIDDCDFH